MNATFTYIKPKTISNSSSSSGSVANLIDKRANFAFNAYAYAPYNYNDSVEQTTAFDHVEFCVIVPRNGMKPVAFNIFYSMAPIMWIMVLVSFMFVIMVLVVFQRVRKMTTDDPKKYLHCTTLELAVIVLQSFLGKTVERVNFHSSIRLILLGWLVYSFFITNAFTAKIISSLIKPNFRDNINTIAELSQSNLTILYPKVIEKNLRKGFDDDSWKLLGDNLKEITTWEEHVMIMNRNKTQYGYVLADYYCLHMVNTNIDLKTGESIYHMVPECLVSHPKVYFVQRGSMYLGYINELLGLFHEMGMFRKWIAEMKFQALLKGYNVGNEDEEEDEIDYGSVKVVITMEYLQTPFYMLALGLSTATIIFFIENRWYDSQRKRNLERPHQNYSDFEEIEDIENTSERPHQNYSELEEIESAEDHFG